MHNVTIIGGGIAGLEAAIFYRKEGFDVELISERNYLYNFPLSIWIPVGKKRFEEVALPLEAFAKRHQFVLTIDRVIAIDPKTKTITLETEGDYQVNHLVIALGAGKMKHQGIEHTLSICGDPQHAILLKEKIDALINKGSGKIAFGFGGNPHDLSGVRGGPAFELFFNLHHQLTKRGIRDQFEMTFFAPMPSPGAKMGEKALRLMGEMFHHNHFHKRYGKKIKTFVDKGVIFEDDSFLASDLTMFVPAGEGLGIIQESSLPLTAGGFIVINDYCEIEGVSGWYAIGDAAALEGPDWKAKQGHLAEIMARNAAHNSAIAVGLKTGEKKGYQKHLAIVCMMDMGNGAGFLYRDATQEHFIPLPFVGHWLKQGWGWYYKMSKMGYIPRLPGM